MRVAADDHYRVERYPMVGARADQVRALACNFCSYRANVVALHRAGDKSGAGRYYRARAKMVKHLHAEHREALELERIEAIRDSLRAAFPWNLRP